MSEQNAGAGGSGPLSEAQLEAVKGLVNNTINGAITSLKRTLDGQRQKDNESLKSDLAKVLGEQIATLRPPADEGEGGKDGKGKRGDSAELATLRKQLADLEKRAADSDKRAAEARVRERNGLLRQKTLDALGAGGSAGSYANHAVDLLLARGLVKFADDESEDVLFADSAAGDVDVAIGVASWLKSDDGAIYVPPRGLGGSGARPPSRGVKDPQKPTVGDMQDALGSAVLSQFALKPTPFGT